VQQIKTPHEFVQKILLKDNIWFDNYRQNDYSHAIWSMLF